MFWFYYFFYLFTQPFIQAQIEEDIKAPRHWLSIIDTTLRYIVNTFV